MVRAVAEALGPHPAGLGPSFVELRGSVPASHATGEAIDALVAQAPPEARAILDRLTWGPPVGVLGTAGPTATAGAWLLAHQLISPLSADHVVVPREVALRLRGDRLHRRLDLEPPPLELTTHTADSVDDAAGGQASDLLGLVDEVAADWGPRPPRVLRAGGLAVRDLRRLATRLDVEPDHAAFVAEIAYIAGLVADDGSLEPVWAPTPAYDEWQQRPSADRWAVLASAWLVSGRAPHLVGSDPVRRQRHRQRAEQRRAVAADPPAARRRAARARRPAPAGAAPARAGLSARIRWRRPLRRAEIVDAVVTAALREAEWLGVTGRGALGGAGRALVGAGREAPADVRAAATSMASHLPSPVEHVLLQADLTAVAPGRLEGSLAPVHAARRRRRVTRRRDRLPLLRRQPAPRPGRRLVVGPDPHRAAGRQPHPGAPAAGVPRRRRRPAARPDPRRARSPPTSAATTRPCSTACSPTAACPRCSCAASPRRCWCRPVQAATTLDMLRDNGYAPVAESMDGGVMVPPTSHHRTPARRAPASAGAQLGGGRGVHRDAGGRRCARARRRRTTTAPARSPSPARGCPRPSRR